MKRKLDARGSDVFNIFKKKKKKISSVKNKKQISNVNFFLFNKNFFFVFVFYLNLVMISDLSSLFDGISTFVGYLMPKSFF